MKRINNTVLFVSVVLAVALSGVFHPVFAAQQTMQTVDTCETMFVNCRLAEPVDEHENVEPELIDNLASEIYINKSNYTYTVTTKGAVTADVSEFAALVAQTFADSRGWAQIGATFTRVSGNANFNLILSEAAYLPSYSSGCSVYWSCRVGTSVIINQDRWNGATDSWNGASGSLRDYRHMVVNHEVGHYLGYGHKSCGGAGQLAPIMQQQSIDLQGCKHNAWPLASEL